MDAYDEREISCQILAFYADMMFADICRYAGVNFYRTGETSPLDFMELVLADCSGTVH